MSSARRRTRLVAAAVGTTLACLTMPSAAVPESHYGMEICSSFRSVCMDLTSQMDCRSHFDGVAPKPIIDVDSCQSVGHYDTFLGHCRCAGLQAGPAVLRELVDFSVSDALPYLTANVTDFGKSFTSVCTTLLKGSKCPASLQNVKAYASPSSTNYATFKGDCSCGSIVASGMVRDAVVGHMVSTKFATTIASTPATPEVPATENTTAIPATVASLDMCRSFNDTCATWLTDVTCPSAQRVNQGCSTPGSTASLVGTCRCGALDGSAAIKAELVKYTVASDMEASKVYTDATATRINMCGTYEKLCSTFLNKAQVPAEEQESSSNCVGTDGTNLATFNPNCGAESGSLDVSQALLGLLISKSVEGDVPDLVCLGTECNPYTLTPGVMAILIISAVLLFIGLVTYAYQRGDAWAHALLSNPLVNRMMSPFAAIGNLFRRRAAKESPADTHHQVHLRGQMA